MSGCSVDIKEVRLNACGIHGLCRTTGNDEILFLCEALLNTFHHVLAQVRIVNASIDEVIPSENLLPPQLECVQQKQISTVGEGELVLAILDPSINGVWIIVHAGIGDKVVDAVHLHGDFLVNGNLAANHLIPEFAVINRRCGVR